MLMLTAKQRHGYAPANLEKFPCYPSRTYAVDNNQHMNAIHELTKETVRFLNSGQVITDLTTIVKELIENALDAEADSIEVKLVDYGISAIAVKDNGRGIPEPDRKQMAKRFCTSKLDSFEKLSSVLSYGFRGEALNSICAVSKETQIITKTKTDAVAKLYNLDVTGSIINEKNHVAGAGTMVIANKPFYNIPVRRQLAQKNGPHMASKVQDLLIAYGLIHPNVRFVLLHTQSTVGTKKKPQNWIKPAVADRLEDVKVIFGKSLADMLLNASIDESPEAVLTGQQEDYENEDADNPTEDDKQNNILHIDAVLPMKGADHAIVCKGDHIYVYVNNRPIVTSKSDLKEVVSLVRSKYHLSTNQNEDLSRKTPFILLNFSLPPNQYDVNVEPSKNVVLLHQKQRVLNLLETLLDRLYVHVPEQPAATEPGSQTEVYPPTRQEQPPPTTVPEITTNLSRDAQLTVTEILGNAQARNESGPGDRHNPSTAHSPLVVSRSNEITNDLDDTVVSSGNFMSRSTNNTASTSVLLEDSDEDDLALVASLASTDLPSATSPTGTASTHESRISSADRLQQWQFQGGDNKVRSRQAESEHEDEEPLFRSSKKPRATENSVETPSLQPLHPPPSQRHNVESLPRHSITAGQTSPSSRQNGFELLMMARDRESRRARMGVEHTRIDEPTQSTLTSYVTSPNRDSNASFEARPSVIQQPRPSTPIQNISQTPIDTRRRRQHTTLHHMDNTLVETLNQHVSHTVDVSQIRQKYRLHQARMTKFYRSPLGEYKSLCPKHVPANTQHIVTLDHDLDIYASVYYYATIGAVVGDVAVVNTNRAKVALQFRELVATKDLSNSVTDEYTELHLSAHETELLHTLSQADGIVSDPRLLMNGIMIKLTQDTLLARFSNLIDYGDQDVHQILQSIERGETVAGSRPSSVVKLLKTYANRENKPLTGDLFTLEPPAALMLAW